MSRLASVLPEHNIRSAGWPATTGEYFLLATRIIIMTSLRSDVRLVQLPLLFFLCYPSYHARILPNYPHTISRSGQYCRLVRPSVCRDLSCNEQEEQDHRHRRNLEWGGKTDYGYHDLQFMMKSS